MADKSTVAFGAFLDQIVWPLESMSRLGRPSIVDEALEMLRQPRYRWIAEGMRDALNDVIPNDRCQECGVPVPFGHLISCRRAASTFAEVSGLGDTTEAVPEGSCRLPPEGWYCSLDAGHPGPCPTRARWPLPGV